MFCSNCGKEIGPDTKFCPFCGHEVAQGQNQQDDIYSHSYYKEGYGQPAEKHKHNEFSFLEVFFKGVGTTIILLLCIVGVLFIKNYISGDIFDFNRSAYEKYVENPSIIPELTQPQTLEGLVKNLKEVQYFLELYLKYSDDDMDVKLETFDRYRKELLKLQNFNNTNILNGDVKYKIAKTEKEFKTLQKRYSKQLSKVGLMIEAEDSYSRYHLLEDSRFTYKKYAKYLSDDVAEYLRIRALHYQPCMYKDKLIIKPQKLAERVGDYEKFMNENKDFRYIDEVKDYLFSYTFIYVFTSDRQDKVKTAKKVFAKSDRKFIELYPNSKLREMFNFLLTSKADITSTEFDRMYPYQYQRTLTAIKPDKSDLTDIFSTVRKNIIKLHSDDNFQYMYNSSEDSWLEYDPSKPLKKGDIVLAKSYNGYEVFDYKYKKTNQTIQLEEGAKFFIKDNMLLSYSQKHLQILGLESSYGSFSFRPLSVKAIKRIFPNVLIINIDTFGEYSVRIDKPTGMKTYMLISTSGGNYEGYRLSGNMELGELGNIFTVSSDNAQVDLLPQDGGEGYHMYFITQPSNVEPATNSVE